MPPKKKGGKKKKKGPTAAELEAMRLAEEEAERRRLEQEELERQRVRWQEELEKQKIERAEKQVAVDESLEEEKKEALMALSVRNKELREAEQKQLDREDWVKFLECSELPDANKEGELNTYISAWREHKGDDVDPVLDDCQAAEDINNDMAGVISFAQERRHEGWVNVLKEIQYELRDISNQKLDIATAKVLMYSEELQTENKTLQISLNMPDIKFGMWVNMAKNLRVKKIEYEDLNTWFDLPKALVLANVAVRMVHFTYDHFSHRSMSEYVSVGGVFSMDLMAIPPPPVEVKGWTMRQMNGLENNLVVLPYPLPPTGAEYAPAPRVPMANQGGPSFRISFPLAEHIVLRTMPPKIGWWDEEDQNWNTDGVHEPQFDSVHRTIKFETTRMAAFALLSERFIDIPYESWMIYPNGVNSAIFVLKTSFEEIQIEIGEGYCTLKEPSRPELQRLTSPLRPGHLLNELVRSGYLIMPKPEAAEKIEGIELKSTEIDDKTTFEVSCAVAGFAVSSSRWNHRRGPDECVVRIHEHLDHSKPPPEPESPGWQHLAVNKQGVTFMPNCIEAMQTQDGVDVYWPVEGEVDLWTDILKVEYHYRLEQCLKEVDLEPPEEKEPEPEPEPPRPQYDSNGKLIKPPEPQPPPFNPDAPLTNLDTLPIPVFSADAIARVKSAAPAFQEAVRYLLIMTRALSFQRPPMANADPAPAPVAPVAQTTAPDESQGVAAED